MEELTPPKAWIPFGAVAAAFGASICCILPIAVAVLGVGSAALGAYVEPFRPYLMGLSAVFLALAFYQSYRPRQGCAPGQACTVPENRRRQRLLLWIVTAVVVLLVAFPYYAGSVL